jgi:hypothetical protein
MSEGVPVIARPPVGFVVEGQGEYACYPSLVAAITGTSGSTLNWPRVNAGGYGNILRNIDRYLEDLVKASHPCNVIVTLDLREPIRDGLYRDCRELRADLEARIRAWQQCAEQRSYLHPLPENIVVVVQIQSLETWVAADICSLQRLGYMRRYVQQPTNVDEAIPNPKKWLQAHLIVNRDLKHRDTAKEIMRCLEPEVMRANSRSFDKFLREVRRLHGLWCGEYD